MVNLQNLIASFKEIPKEIEKYFLKRKARKHWQAYTAITKQYTCGRTLANQFSGGMLYHHRNMFNIVMDQLKCLDEDTPKGRL